MDPDNPQPIDRKSRLTQRDVDTEKAEADNTLMDIDQVVRDAVRSPIQGELDSRAEEMIARLAKFETIRNLAAITEPLPELGAYELLDELGHGGMGTVYRAKHRQLGKIQALKVIHGQSGLTPEIRARFRREVQAIGALKHPNIIAAHDADFEGDVPYLVMDYVEGESLFELQKRFKSEGRTISIGAACELVRQAALGLQYAHSQQITHRDIKPGNLMLDGEGVVRVLDLGLARLGAQDDESKHEATELTRGGQILGTPDYMSPEQLQSSRDVDARTDVYALGVTLFSLLVGSPVYRSKPGESFIAKATRIIHEPVPSLRKLLPDIPKPLADIITRCLAKSPDDRIQTAGEIADGLAPWASTDEVHTLLPGYVAPAATPAQGLPESQQSNGNGVFGRVLIGIALAVLLPLLIAAGVMLTLRLPGGGELIVSCDDPNAAIRVVAVKDGQRKDLTLSQEDGNKLRLEEGSWTVLIEGVDAAEFSISENEIVINGSTPTSIRVTRKEAVVGEQAGVAGLPASAAEGRSRDNAVANTVPNTVGNKVSSVDKERVVDWQHLRATGEIRGLLPAAIEQDDLARWQIRPWLPTLTQHAHYLTENRIALDQAGQYYAVISPYDCKVIELASGRVTHTIPSPKDSPWGGVAITAQAEQVALLSTYGNFVEVRDERNRIIAQCNTNERIDTASCYGAIAWLKPGNQLLIWDSRSASVVDLDGKLQTSIDFEVGAGPDHDPYNEKMLVQRSVATDPRNQRVAFGCSDGHLRIWNIPRQTLNVLPSERDDETIRAVHWSPDGEYVGAMRVEQSHYGVALEIWNDEGELQNTIEAAQLNSLHQFASEFTWSPDSRSIALGSGNVIDPDGEVLRELNLLGAEREHGSPRISSAWIPSWTTTDAGTQRIDFVATGDTYGLQCGRVTSFTPTGRLLPSSPRRNILQPQEISWIEETGEFAVVFSEPDSSLLRTWTSDGETLQSVAIPQFVSGKIQARTGKLLCHTGNEVSIFDRSGSQLGSYSHGPSHGFELVQWQWDHSGDRIANFGRDNSGGVIRLVDDSGKLVDVLQLPPSVSAGGFDASSGYLFWSPDDKYVALTLLLETAEQHVFVWKIAGQAKTPIFALSLPDDQTPRLAWSPDSQYLAIAPGTIDSENGTILRFLHVGSVQVKEHVTKHDYYPQWHLPEWFDARSIRIGGIALNIPAEPDGEIQVHDLGFTLQNAQAAVNMKNTGEVLLVTSNAQEQSFEVWKDGALKSESPAPLIATSDFRKNADRTKAVFFTGNPHNGFAQVDLSTGLVDYIGLALDNESAVKLAADGSLPNANTELDDYLGYTLRYPGGAEQTLTRAAFEQRQQEDESQAALRWILDIGGVVQAYGSDTWLSNREIADNLAALSPTQIVSIDLTGCMLTNESLAQLVHFENLKTLDLSNTRLASLKFLPELEQLTSLSLRRLQLNSLSTLQYVGTLRHLDLSHSPFDSSIAATLVSARNLQTLILASTNVDRFLLSDIAQLPNLTDIDVRQTQILPTDVAKFSEAHPSIRSTH